MQTDSSRIIPLQTDLYHAARIVIFCVVAAVFYGILHDQVTARVCIEYFTIGHPPIFSTNSSTLLGIGWGIVATWWVGVLLGCPLAIAARFGNRPKLAVPDLTRRIGILLLVMGTSALVAGYVGYTLAEQGSMPLDGPLGERVPADRHVAFMADSFAHLASYLIGFLGGIVVIFNTWWRRRLMAGGLIPRL